MKVVRLKRAKIELCKVKKISRRLYGEGQDCAPTNICKISQL